MTERSDLSMTKIRLYVKYFDDKYTEKEEYKDLPPTGDREKLFRHLKIQIDKTIDNMIREKKNEGRVYLRIDNESFKKAGLSHAGEDYFYSYKTLSDPVLTSLETFYFNEEDLSVFFGGVSGGSMCTISTIDISKIEEEVDEKMLKKVLSNLEVVMKERKEGSHALGFGIFKDVVMTGYLFPKVTKYVCSILRKDYGLELRKLQEQRRSYYYVIESAKKDDIRHIESVIDQIKGEKKEEFLEKERKKMDEMTIKEDDDEETKERKRMLMNLHNMASGKFF